MKAIETVYKDYNFRSRGEARWAVFFDAMNIKWQYETEGYDLGRNYGWYLPDFYLSQLKCWIEIKPDRDLEESEYRKIRAFGSYIGPILCFTGLPSLSWNGTLFCKYVDSSSGGEYENYVGFAYCRECEKVVISISDEDRCRSIGDRILLDPNYEEFYLCDTYSEHRGRYTVQELEYGISAAKQSRFEHGQFGPPSKYLWTK